MKLVSLHFDGVRMWQRASAHFKASVLCTVLCISWKQSLYVRSRYLQWMCKNETNHCESHTAFCSSAVVCETLKEVQQCFQWHAPTQTDWVFGTGWRTASCSWKHNTDRLHPFIIQSLYLVHHQTCHLSTTRFKCSWAKNTNCFQMPHYHRL